jgi:phosphoribosylformimino-5-aminoimidazole carboxamide ribotide isomerase
VQVIPVIDLKGGEVVRGVGGRREEYRAVQTRLTEDTTPGGIARAFVERFGFREAYVADLDAIAGAEPNWSALESIGRAGLRLWVDAGVADAGRAGKLAAYRNAPLGTVIVGLESLDSPRCLNEIVQTVGSDRAAFSLDLKDGRPLVKASLWRDQRPEAIAEAVLAVGIRRLIVLDLSHVGEDRGVGGAELCHRLHRQFPDVELIGGGGVRRVDDARVLARCGCRAVLIASALHDGRLTPEHVAEIERC